MAILANRVFYRGIRLLRPSDLRVQRPNPITPAYYMKQIAGNNSPEPLFSSLVGSTVEFVYSASDGDKPLTGTGYLLGTSERYVTLGCGEMVLHLDHSRLIRMSDFAA